MWPNSLIASILSFYIGISVIKTKILEFVQNFVALEVRYKSSRGIHYRSEAFGHPKAP